MNLENCKIKHFKIVLLLSFIFTYSCNNSETKTKNVENTPYKIFFNELKINNLTDTILVQNQTKLFGCGTAIAMYEEEIKSKGIDQFYEKYGTVVDDRELINSFAKKNNVKILWIYRGIEGELLQLEDSILHKNTQLEKRLLAEKTFLSFDDNPKTLDSLNISVTSYNPPKNTSFLYSFDLSKNKNAWKLDKQNEQIVK